MKLLLFFPLLFFLFPYVLPKDAAKPYEDFLEQLNEMRSKYAKNDRIYEMYRLVYNSSLESLASKPSDTVESKRSFWISTFDDPKFFPKLDFDVEAFPKFGLDSNSHIVKLPIHPIPQKDNYENLEAMVPLQRQIGCTEAHQHAGIRCYLSPETTFDLWPRPYYGSTEKPGKDCKYPYVISDHLCTFVGVNTNFTSRLNNIRRKIAKSHKIMEMFEVKFDSEIASLANPKELTRHAIYEAEKQGFGFFKIPTYDIDEKEFAAEIKNFLKLSDTARKTDMEKSNGIKYGEFISPSATIFGCQWDESQKCFQCIIGPRHSPYPILKNPLKILGTDCPDGFKNDKGLCIQDEEHPKSILRIVNQARRAAAKVFEIGNMTELTWSKDLHLTVKNWDGKSSQEIQNIMDSEKYVKWRYDSPERATLQGKLSRFLIKWTQKSLPEKFSFFENGKDFHEMEYLNPDQTKIGCALFTESGAEKQQLACLIGPNGKFDDQKLVNRRKENEWPGSKCPAHLKSKNGLCVNIGDREEFLKNVNSFRKDHANSYNITDMHELIWNNELEKIAQSTSWTRSEAPSTKPYRFVILEDYHLSKERLKSEMAALKNLGSSKREILFKKIHGSSLGISELVEPLQKFIGCAAKDQEKADVLLCVIGPREILQPWRLENRGVRIPGTKSKYLPFIPGSNCSSGYSNSDGLCTPKNSSTLTLFGTQEEFIENLNIYRRQLAMEYNTNWMFELYHSKDLQSMLDVLDWDVPWPLARVSFRYLKFRSFNSAIDKLPGEFTELKKLSQKERRIQVYQTNTTAGYLELLEPQQHLIACKVKQSEKDRFENSKEFVVCLLGPMGEMEMWSLNEGFPFDRAAFCGDSSLFYQQSGMKQKFVGVDGLCTKTPESKVSYFGSRRWFLQQANLARKDRARRYATPDMMELIWDKELEESAKNLPYDSQKPPRLYNEGYRWMKLATYNWHLDWIKEQFFDHISFKDKNEVAKWIDKQKPTSMGILELFAKGQSKIGCAKRNTSAEMFILCLLGPKSEFNLIALEKEYVKGLPKKAGSRCPTGYQNDDGLCRRDQDMPPKKTKKRRTRTTTTSTSASSTTREAKKSEATPWNVFCILLLTSSILLIMNN
ncbi:hypothetical protein B9Z55_007961 [Caenorhabditis nigoni]|uniref:SCP domain-containing protein n=1 Tax=Caenorhabditis nigoni TaxID=1611254 RepID=A0A2G5VBY8_9PELO|nr:hypothetical protein B9Z55_007961 [Caenorhabditis nigoni]